MPKYNVRRKAQLGLDIREGGIAIPIAPNMYYMNGRSHDNGGIAIGPNNKNGLEVEGGEVVKVGKNDIKVFSSVPLLRGVSPAELVMGGANPNKVFKAQEEFKDRNRINDDGTTYEMGGQKTNQNKPNRSRPVIGILPYGYTIKNLYEVENPNRKGIKGKIATMYDNRTVGAGVDVVSGHPELKKIAKRGRLTKKLADETAVIHLRKDDNVIRNNYADVYGKTAADTLSYGPRFLVAQARYQQGNVRKAWPAIHKAMAKGDAKALKKAVLQVTPKDHTYRRQWIEGFKVYKTGGIYIKPSKRGTFTAAATKHGMGVQEFASKVLANKEDYSHAMVKKANFARNASRWKKEYGGDGNVLPEVVVTGKKPKTFFEKLDDYANIGEKALAVPNLALSGASLISPNPFTIGGAYLTNIGGALLDLYQGGRAVYQGDWFNVGKNAIDLGLSLVGLRALRNANKLNELDKSLDASGAVREYVRKSVGRGRGKRKATFTKEKNEAITQEAIGYGSIPASTAFSMLDTDKNRKEYGGSMIYTINGNVKNGLTLRPKATLGTKKEDEEKKKKNPNEARYASRIKKGKAQEVTAKPVTEYNEAADKNPDKYRYTRAAGFKNEVKTSSTGGGTQSKDSRWIGQYKTTNVGDWIGLGSNLAGSVASYFMTKNAINKMPEPIKPVMAQAAKLKTKYNVEPQLTEIREAEQMNRAAVRRNTQSSNTSLTREQRLMNEARGARNTLYGQKENIETQLINQDRLNRQSVMRDNIRAYNEYLNRVTATKMAQNEMRVSNINNFISGLTGSVSNILGTIESRRAANNTLRAIAAANPNVDARLIGGFDYYIDSITKKKYNKNQ